MLIQKDDDFRSDKKHQNVHLKMANAPLVHGNQPMERMRDEAMGFQGLPARADALPPCLHGSQLFRKGFAVELVLKALEDWLLMSLMSVYLTRDCHNRSWLFHLWLKATQISVFPLLK